MKNRTDSILFGVIAFMGSLLMLLSFCVQAENVSEDGLLTPHERQWLDSHSEDLAVGVEFGYPPLSFIRKGKVEGFTNDYLNLLEEKLDVRFRRQLPAYLPVMLSELERKEIAFGGSLHRDDIRAKLFDFSVPYIDVPVVFIVKERAEKLDFSRPKGLIVAMVDGSAAHAFMEKNHKSLIPSPQDDVLTCLLRVSTGLADAALVALPVASHLIEEKGVLGLKVDHFSDLTYRLRFAVRRDLPQLTAILNKGIGAVEKAEYDAIYNRWVHFEQGPFYTTRQFMYYLLGAVSTIGLIIILIFIWNLKLRAAVRKRSEELIRQQMQLNLEIAKRKEKQQQLKERENRLRSMLGAMPDMVWFKNPEGQYRFCNGEFENYCGYLEKELVGETDFSLYEADKAAKLHSHDQQVLARQRSVVTEEVVTYGRSNKSAVLETIKVPVRTPDGDDLGVLGVGRDISLIKKVEQDFGELYEQLETILQNVNGFTYRIKNDPTLTLEFVSDHIHRFTGKKAEELMYTPHSIWGQVLYEEDRKVFLQTFLERVESTQSREKEIRLQHVNGDIFWVVSKSFPIFDDHGNVTHVDGILMDISKEKLLKDNLAQTRQMEAVGILAGGIAHDFNNLLSGILGFGELLREDLRRTEGCPEEMRRAAEGIVHGGKRVKALVAQILTFSRMNREGSSIVRTDDVIRNVVELLRSSLPKSVAITTSSSSEKSIHISSDRLHQLILSLCTDSVALMRNQHGEISITLRDEHPASETDSVSAALYQCLTINSLDHDASSDMPAMESGPSFHPISVGEELHDSVIEEFVVDVGGYMKIDRSEQGSRVEIYIPVYTQEELLEAVGE